MIFLLGEVAAEVVMMVVMFPLPLPGCPLPPELAAAAAAEVMIALASGFLGIDDSKSWSRSSSSSCRDWVITIGGGDIYSGFERGMGNAA